MQKSWLHQLYIKVFLGLLLEVMEGFSFIRCDFYKLFPTMNFIVANAIISFKSTMMRSVGS